MCCLQVIKIEWVNKDMREVCFVFLFNKFKMSYLLWLLPDFDRHRTIYDPDLGKLFNNFVTCSKSWTRFNQILVCFAMI